MKWLLSLIVAMGVGGGCSVSRPTIGEMGQTALSEVIMASTCMRPARGGEIWGGIAAVLMPEKCIVWEEVEMQSLRARFGDDVIYGIFFHELGHYFLDHQKPSFQNQLEADAFAGCWLVKTGRSVGPYLDALESITTKKKFQDRAVATIRGAELCTVKNKPAP